MAIVLKNDRLLLTIEEPGQFYTGSRFDHTANIVQVTLDENLTFCSGEVTGRFDPKRNGCGLYNEFGINMPVGYDDCPVGGYFPKIGVGLLSRTDEKPYNFFATYRVKPFQTQFECDGDSVIFTVFPDDCRGYSVKLTKTVKLSENTFTVAYRLENTGSERIRTNEYCHNFISICNSSIDTRYSLTVPLKITDQTAMFEAVNPEKAVTMEVNKVKFQAAPTKDFFFSPLTEFGTKKGEWILAHTHHGVAMRESVDFIPEIMNLWGTAHVISPELFIKIDIMPGEILQWHRKFEFFYL